MLQSKGSGTTEAKAWFGELFYMNWGLECVSEWGSLLTPLVLMSKWFSYNKKLNNHFLLRIDLIGHLMTLSSWEGLWLIEHTILVSVYCINLKKPLLLIRAYIWEIHFSGLESEKHSEVMESILLCFFLSITNIK